MTSPLVSTSALPILLLLTSPGLWPKTQGEKSTTRLATTSPKINSSLEAPARSLFGHGAGVGVLTANVISNNTTKMANVTLRRAQRHLSIQQSDKSKPCESQNPETAPANRTYPVDPGTTDSGPLDQLDRHADEASDSDLTILFGASAPGDLLNDAEVDEIVNEERAWSTDTKVKMNLKPIAKSIAKDGLVSRQTYRQFSRVSVYVVFPLILIGFVANVIAFKVFRNLPRNVTNTYMTCLICFDIAYLVFVASSHIVFIFRSTWGKSSVRYFLQLYVVYKFFILSSRQVIVTTTAFMCLDRYLVLASPFRLHKSFVFRRPKLLILLAALLILTFNSHKLLKRQVKRRQIPGGSNHTTPYLAYSQLYLDNQELLDDLTIVSSCLFQYCPLFAMLVANISLMISLYRYSFRVGAKDVSRVKVVMTSSRNKYQCPPCGEADDSKGSEMKKTGLEEVGRKPSKFATAGKGRPDKQFYQLERHKCVAVISYSLLFFFLALPLALLPILKKVFPQFNVLQSQHYLFLVYVRIFPVLDIISASINFFVFFIKGGAFRAGLYKIVGCKKRNTRRNIFRLSSFSCAEYVSTMEDKESITDITTFTVVRRSLRLQESNLVSKREKSVPRMRRCNSFPPTSGFSSCG